MKTTIKDIINKLNQLDYEINIIKTDEKDLLVGVTNRLDELRTTIENYENKR